MAVHFAVSGDDTGDLWLFSLRVAAHFAVSGDDPTSIGRAESGTTFELDQNVARLPSGRNDNDFRGQTAFFY